MCKHHFSRPIVLLWACHLWICSLAGLRAQQVDTLQLLDDKQLKADITSALDSMYNFNFPVAYKHFNWIKQEHPRHPLPYLLHSLNFEWQRVPNIRDRQYDEALLNYADTAIQMGKQIMNEGAVTEGAFFLAITYAILGRLHGEHEEWWQAVWAIRNALKYMEICKQKTSLSAEILLGEALYNYYSVWMRENYPKLRLVIALFKSGDKALGLEQLTYVANNAFYVRVEAQRFRLVILTGEKDKQEQAFQLTEYLHQRYPNNAYFHRYYARFLYQEGKYSRCVQICEEILQRVADHVPGYESNSARQCAFFLGWMQQYLHNQPELAKAHYKQSLHYAKQAQAMQKGYTLSALLYLGDIAKQEALYAEAAAYYKQAETLAKRNKNVREKARKRKKVVKRKKRRAAKQAHKKQKN